MDRAEKGPFTTTSDFDRWIQNVWQVVEGIPRGHVLTYGEVARLAGMSRQVSSHTAATITCRNAWCVSQGTSTSRPGTP